MSKKQATVEHIDELIALAKSYCVTVPFLKFKNEYDIPDYVIEQHKVYSNTGLSESFLGSLQKWRFDMESKANKESCITSVSAYSQIDFTFNSFTGIKFVTWMSTSSGYVAITDKHDNVIRVPVLALQELLDKLKEINGNHD